MGDDEEELLEIWGITKSWSKDIDLCNGPDRKLSWPTKKTLAIRKFLAITL